MYFAIFTSYNNKNLPKILSISDTFENIEQSIKDIMKTDNLIKFIDENDENDMIVKDIDEHLKNIPYEVSDITTDNYNHVISYTIDADLCKDLNLVKSTSTVSIFKSLTKNINFVDII